WVLDTTGTPAKRPNTAAVFAVEVYDWRAADGSGLSVLTRAAPAYDINGSEPDYRSADREFAHAPTTRTRYRAGTVGSPIAEPLATDPAGLARQLAFDPQPDGPQSTLRAVDELHTVHCVARPTRAAALEVLAGVHGLSYVPDAVDRLGRHGFAVSL